MTIQMVLPYHDKVQVSCKNHVHCALLQQKTLLQPVLMLKNQWVDTYRG